jgi:predicted nuclease with TOPRIM domain
VSPAAIRWHQRPSSSSQTRTELLEQRREMKAGFDKVDRRLERLDAKLEEQRKETNSRFDDLQSATNGRFAIAHCRRR